VEKIEFNLFKGMCDWMSSADPALLLRLRRANGWLVDHLPEVRVLYGIPQDARWHPEIDTGLHVELTLAQAASLSGDLSVRFAALVHDLGKGVTSPDFLPSHPGHEEAGGPLVDLVCDRFEVSDDWRVLAKLVCKYHLHSHRALEMSPRGVVRFFREAELYDKPQLLDPFLTACLADKRGRAGLEDAPYEQMDFLLKAFHCSSECSEDDPNRLNQSRIKAVVEVRKQF
jgi:tRNA nucleotidyltransferase (CCA-adding enzyme)